MVRFIPSRSTALAQLWGGAGSWWSAPPSWLVLLLIAGFWFGLLTLSEALTSGYHFMDDHEIVRIHGAFTTGQQSWLELLGHWSQVDFGSGRFRPLYYPHRILETWVLGVNWWLWSLYVGSLGIFTTFALWTFARYLDFSSGEALLWAALITLGPQSAVWWQLGPPETFAMAVLAIALLLLPRTIQAGPRRLLYEGLWIGTVILLSLSKESLILFIPALVGLKLWVTRQHRNTWRQVWRQNAATVLILAVVVGAELLTIKLFIGLAGPGYGGVLGIQLSDLWSTLAQLSQVGLWWLALPSYGALVVLTLTRRQSLQHLWFPPVLWLAIVLPQVFLHAKTGISHRYILPGIIGYAWLTVWAYRGLRQQSLLISRLILGLLIACLVVQGQTAWTDARRFAVEGRAIQGLMRSLETQTTREDSILLVSHPRSYAEWSLALKSYLAVISDRPNLYLEVYSGQDSSFYRLLDQTFAGRTADKLPDRRTARCITIFPELQKAFLRRSRGWFVPQQYQHQVFGPFYRTINPRSEIHLYCKK